MKSKISGIYAIVCSKNEKSYIGSTCNFAQRKETHLSNLRNNKHINQTLQNDFNLFGEESFHFELIEETKNVREREKYWISVDENLYNIDSTYTKIPALDKEDIKKFWSSVEKVGDCLEWKIKKQNKRPRFCYKNIRVVAARVAYKIKDPNFDESLLVCHTCDNPQCVNPDHLFLGTQEDNMKDRINKGRGRIKLNKEIVDKIREEYLKDITKNSTHIRKWLLDNFGINLARNSMNKILNNYSFYDKNYNSVSVRNKISFRGKNKQGEI